MPTRFVWSLYLSNWRKQSAAVSWNMDSSISILGGPFLYIDLIRYQISNHNLIKVSLELFNTYFFWVFEIQLFVQTSNIYLGQWYCLFIAFLFDLLICFKLYFKIFLYFFKSLSRTGRQTMISPTQSHEFGFLRNLYTINWIDDGSKIWNIEISEPKLLSLVSRVS